MSEEIPESPVPGLACYRDQGRICGPDCMAYLPQAPAGPTYLGQQWAHCHLLVNIEKTGRHLTIIAGEVSKENARKVRASVAPKAG